MKRYKIKSCYDAVIVCENGQQFLNTNQTLILDGEDAISVYPVAANAVSFVVNLESEMASAFYSKVEDGDVFYILLLPQPTVLTYTKIAVGDAQLEIGSKKIVFLTDKIKKEVLLNENFDRYQTGMINSNVYCLLTNNSSQLLASLNLQSGKIEQIYGEEVKIDDRKIDVVKHFSQASQSKIHEEYFFTSTGLEKSESTQSLSSKVVTSTNDIVNCYCFLDAIKNGDYEKSKQYLTLSLRRQTSETDLKQFFGNIKTFFHLDKSTFAIVNSKTQKLTFTMKDGKIDEIEL